MKVVSDRFIGSCKKLFVICRSRAYPCVRLVTLSKIRTTSDVLIGVPTEIRTEHKPKALQLPQSACL